MAKSSGPPVQKPRVPGEQNVHVVETFNRFWAVNCTQTRLAAGLRPDPLGSYSAPLGPLAVIRGREGGNGKERVGNKKWGKGRM